MSDPNESAALALPFPSETDPAEADAACPRPSEVSGGTADTSIIENRAISINIILCEPKRAPFAIGLPLAIMPTPDLER